MTTSRGLVQLLAPLALAVVLAHPIGAQAAPERNHLYDKFQLTGGFAFVRFNTTIRVDTPDGPGTEIDVEDDLNADRTVPDPRFGLRWQISRKHSLEFGYLFARRTGERTLQRDIEYQGETYDAGLLVKTKFDSDLASLTWRWAFHASDKSQIGATLGLGAILFRTGLDGYLSVNDQTAEVSASRDLTAPVGSLGAFGHWKLSPKWYLEADARGIYIPVDRFEAIVGDLGVAARWFPMTWGGLELGLASNWVRVDINRDPEAVLTGSFEGKIRYAITNIRTGVVIAF
jgi:hypothetical protein